MGGGTRVGRRRRRSRVIIATGDQVTRLNVPTRFAPSVEDCPIEYGFIRERPGTQVSLIITDRDGTEVRRNNLLHLAGDREDVFRWDGRNPAGQYVSPIKSPYTIEIRHASGMAMSRQVNVEVSTIAIWSSESPYVFMNDPEHRITLVSTIMIRRTNGTNTVTAIPLELTYSFLDPAPSNTTQAQSFKYQTGPDKWLGKITAPPSQIYWERHADCTATSDDGFKTKCRVQAITAAGVDRGKAKIYFKPSGVGGNNYTIKASLMDGDREVIARQSTTLTVWRSVAFNNIYEMNSETAVSTNGTTAIISPVFNPAYVRYTAGSPNPLSATPATAATLSVKYIGLWGGTATPQRSWATMQRKTATETPTADEIAKATYTGTEPAALTQRSTARTAIIRKAQAWTDRIDGRFHTDMRQWVSDSRVPNNSLMSIKYYHPKYSQQGGDFQTNEWKLGGASVPAWLRVSAFPRSGGGYYYNNLDPDGLWVNWGGLSHGNGRVSVPKGNSSATTRQVVRHEAGHATNYSFKRDVFGPSLDHSTSSAGIMYFSTTGGTTFTLREKKILRGIIP